MWIEVLLKREPKIHSYGLGININRKGLATKLINYARSSNEERKFFSGVITLHCGDNFLLHVESLVERLTPDTVQRGGKF